MCMDNVADADRLTFKTDGQFRTIVPTGQYKLYNIKSPSPELEKAWLYCSYLLGSYLVIMPKIKLADLKLKLFCLMSICCIINVFAVKCFI